MGKSGFLGLIAEPLLARRTNPLNLSSIRY
jgi:hypothetical protein